MSSASFRSQIARVVSDTLYIPVKQFLAPVEKAAKAFCFVCVSFLCAYVGFFCFKGGGGEDGESLTVKAKLVNLEQCCIYSFPTEITYGLLI